MPNLRRQPQIQLMHRANHHKMHSMRLIGTLNKRPSMPRIHQTSADLPTENARKPPTILPNRRQMDMGRRVPTTIPKYADPPYTSKSSIRKRNTTQPSYKKTGQNVPTQPNDNEQRLPHAPRETNAKQWRSPPESPQPQPQAIDLTLPPPTDFQRAEPEHNPPLSSVITPS